MLLLGLLGTLDENDPGTKAAATGLRMTFFFVLLKPLACICTVALLFLSAEEGGLTGSRMIVADGVDGREVAGVELLVDPPPRLDMRCLPGLLLLSSDAEDRFP